MRTFKWIFMGLLSLVFMFGAMACGGTDKDSSGSPVESSSSEDSSSEDSSSEDSSSEDPEPETTYTVSFVADGKNVGTCNYTLSNKEITEPAVPAKEHYNGAWEAYELTGANITVNAEYTPKVYTIQFIKANGDLVEEVTYTVESESVEEPDVPSIDGYTGKWSVYTLNGGNKVVEPEYTAIMCMVEYYDNEGNLLSTESVQWGHTAENKAIEASSDKKGVWVDEEGNLYDFTQKVTGNFKLKVKLYTIYATPVAGLDVEISSEAKYTFGQEYALKLKPKSWTTTFVFTDQNLPEAAAYKFSAIVNGMGGNSALAIYYCANSNWDNRVKLCEFTEKDKREDVVLSKAQYQALLNGTADLEYCVKEYQGSVSLATCLYISEVSVFVEKETISASSGCNVSYDASFTYGEEEYSTKLTGTGWTMAIKLSGEQVSESEYDYVVLRIYTTDFKCTCSAAGAHAGTQALRNLPTTSYSSGAVSLKDQEWTEIVLKASDYNQLISDGTILQINNSCTAAGKEVWISQPQFLEKAE